MISALLIAPNRSAAKFRVFTANASDNTVSVIDGDLDREVEVIPVGNFPQGLALRERDPLLAVANSRGNSVTLIDPLRMVRRGPEIPVGRFPIDMKFSADGRSLFCTSYDDQSVVVLDVDAGRPVREPVRVGAPPRRIKLSDDGAFAYVLLYQPDGALVVLDTRTWALVGAVTVGAFPTDMVMHPDGKRLMVASFNSDTAAVVDIESLRVVQRFELRVGNGLLIHPRQPLLYSMVTFDNEVAVLDYERQKEVAAIPVGQHPGYSAMTPDGRFVFAVNGTDGNVMKIDTETNRVLVRIAVGVEPTDAVVFDMGSEMPTRAMLVAALVASVIGVLSAGSAWRQRRSRIVMHPTLPCNHRQPG